MFKYRILQLHLVSEFFVSPYPLKYKETWGNFLAFNISIKKNPVNNLKRKSVDWFLYDGNILNVKELRLTVQIAHYTTALSFLLII